MHRREQRTTEHARHTKHVEGVHQDVVLSLEHKHEVECSGYAERHAVRERSLPDGVNKEHGKGCRQRSAVSNTNPRAHAQAVRQFPLTTQPAADANQEVEANQLVRAAVVEPLIKRSCFPDGIEVQADCVAGRNNSTRDDVVSKD
ncbi:MAG: Uncharacterised protein [Prochlorococcus marinus str. MIT 9215]|nr:MAG: Uncharacterised protein [Prochlorococcus marinus str. MIT 9215]